MRNICDYIKEGFYQTIGGVLKTLLNNLVSKGKETYPEDIYKSTNDLADYLVKNNLIKPIRVRGYRFNSHPGIYINYINNENRWNGHRTGGICFRMLDGTLDPYYNQVVVNDCMEAIVGASVTGGVSHPYAGISIRHNVNWGLKGYINGLCTDPAISHFYYIEDEKIIEQIHSWLSNAKSIDGGRSTDETMDSVETIHALDKLQ